MPAPPEESEPAMVSAIGVVMVWRGGFSFIRPVPVRLTSPACGVRKREREPTSAAASDSTSSRFSAMAGYRQARLLSAPNLAYLNRSALGDDSDGSLFHPDQMQARPVLCGGERACGSRNRLRDLFDRGPLRSSGQILRR